MLTKDDLLKFCDSDVVRYDFSEPFVSGDWVCATDGVKMVLVNTKSYKGEAKELSKTPPIDGFLKEIKVFWEVESKRIPELQKPDWLDDKWQLPVDEYEFCFNDDLTWDDEEIKVEFAEHKSAYDRIPFLGCEYHKKHLWALSTLLNITAVYDSKIDSLVCSHAYGWAFLMRLKEEGEK